MKKTDFNFDYKLLKYKVPKPIMPSLRNVLPRKRDIARQVNPFKRIREPISAPLKKKVLARAKNKCEWKGCDKRNGEVKLKFHHIDMNNDHNTLGNMMALCSYHHDLIHVRNKKVSHKEYLTGEEIKTKIVKKEKYKEEKKKMQDKYSLIQRFDVPKFEF